MRKIIRALTGLAAAAPAVGMAQSRARSHPSRQVAEFTLRQLQTGHVHPGWPANPPPRTRGRLTSTRSSRASC